MGRGSRQQTGASALDSLLREHEQPGQPPAWLPPQLPGYDLFWRFGQRWSEHLASGSRAYLRDADGQSRPVGLDCKPLCRLLVHLDGLRDYHASIYAHTSDGSLAVHTNPHDKANLRIDMHWPDDLQLRRMPVTFDYEHRKAIAQRAGRLRLTRFEVPDGELCEDIRKIVVAKGKTSLVDDGEVVVATNLSSACLAHTLWAVADGASSAVAADRERDEELTVQRVDGQGSDQQVMIRLRKRHTEDMIYISLEQIYAYLRQLMA